MDNQKLKQQDSLAPSIFQPSKTLIENWKLWISHEVVGHWKNFSPENSELIILEIDDQDFFNKASNRLKSKIISEKQNLNSLENCKQVDSRIQRFFDEIALGVEERLKVKKTRCLVSFRDSLTANFKSLNPKSISTLIEEQADLLTKRRDYFEEQKNQHLQRQASAGDVYLNLVKKLKSPVSNNLVSKGLKQSIWNALNIYFESKLLVTRYTVLHQTTVELLESCQSYLDSVNGSLEILNQIQRSLKEKSSLHLTSVPVFSYLDKVDVLEQREKIESSVGQRINLWGSVNIPWQEIEAKLLEIIEPITYDIYQEFQECFMEHGLLFANQSKDPSKDHCTLHSTSKPSKNKIGGLKITNG